MSATVHLHVDLDAPIVPGESAAGLRLGHKVAEFLDHNGTAFQTEQVEACLPELKGTERLRSENVDVWVEREIITQVGLHTNYRGAVSGRIRIGDTVGQVVTEFGPVGEDEADNLVAASMPGLCFELPAIDFADVGLDACSGVVAYSREWLDRICEGRICKLFVYHPNCSCGSSLRNRPDLSHCPGCGLIVFEVLDL